MSAAAQMASLYRLQELELELTRLQEQRKIDPVVQEVTKLTNALKKYSQLEVAVNKRIREKKLAVRQSEERLAGFQSEATEVEHKLYSGAVTNPKELSGLETRLATVRGEVSATEDQALKNMEAVDHAQAQLEQVKAMATQLQQHLQTAEQNLADRVAEWDFLEEDYKDEIKEVRADMDPALLSMYERRHSTTNGRPVAKVSHGVCGGCRTELPTSQRQTLGREIISCQRCGRLLYWPS